MYDLVAKSLVTVTHAWYSHKKDKDTVVAPEVVVADIPANPKDIDARAFLTYGVPLYLASMISVIL